jgi:hypothetical protein
MVSEDTVPPGPMFLIDSVADYLANHPDLKVRLQPREIPDGYVAGVEDPAGNVLYVVDQSNETAT